MVSEERAHAEETSSNAEDAELVERALAGDGDAVTRLVDRLGAVIQARAGGVLFKHRRHRPSGRPPRQELEDLTQEIFLVLFRDDGRVLKGWNPTKGLPLDGYVRLVTSRRATSYVDRHYRRRQDDPGQALTIDESGLDLPVPAVGAERIVVARERLERVLECLRSRLNPKGWQMFELFYVEELEVAEIRRQQALSDAAIYQWRSRLRKVARECHEQDSEGRGGGGEKR